MARTRKSKEGRGPSKQEFDPARWSHAVFALGAFAAAWVGAHLVEDVWAFVWSQWPQHVPRPHAEGATALGVLLGVLVGIWAWRKADYFKFVNEVAIEVSQIIWPTKAETRAATIVVVTITLICSGILSVMDLGWSTFTDWLYEL